MGAPVEPPVEFGALPVEPGVLPPELDGIPVELDEPPVDEGRELPEAPVELGGAPVEEFGAPVEELGAPPVEDGRFELLGAPVEPPEDGADGVDTLDGSGSPLSSEVLSDGSGVSETTELSEAGVELSLPFPLLRKVSAKYPAAARAITAIIIPIIRGAFDFSLEDEPFL